ncbi:MAG TPA: hypothetical protein VMR52_10875 [Dehalococcoidia bacterium]|nr:hypothetical protein [Dehalococcoidia bacterium]
MQFVLGVVIGVGVGFAASVLLAPDKTKQQAAAPRGGSLGRPVYANGANGSHGFKSVVENVRKQLDEAMSEAKKAQKEAEAELTARYERMVARSHR